MSAKRILFKITDAAGKPVAGAKVKATDCWELDSNADGLAMFLIDSEEFTVTVNGKEVYSGTLADAPGEIELKV
ncbi:hypothetical protein [Luteimonas sp. e5]